MKDRDVINAFIEFLRGHEHPGLRVDSWPEHENHKSPEIDALAGPFAIEHTSIDTVPNQRRDADWFKQVVENLEREFATSLACRLEIALEYSAIRVGQNWPAIQQAFRVWITDRVPDLAVVML